MEGLSNYLLIQPQQLVQMDEYEMADPSKTILDTKFHRCFVCHTLTDEMDKNLKWPVCINEDCNDYGKSSSFMAAYTSRKYKFYFE